MWKMKNRFLKWRKLQMQLELYYPKDTYERLARKEMKSILSKFNELYYDAYPRMLTKHASVAVDYYPKTHSKQYEVQRAMKLCKTHKVRRRNLVKIEELLNLQYIIEEQMNYYGKEIQKTRSTQRLLDEERFSSFFPELHEKRMGALLKMEAHCLKKMDELHEEKRTCERAISDLLHHQRDIWGDASRLIGDMVSESVKHVVDIVDRSFKR